MRVETCSQLKMTWMNTVTSISGLSVGCCLPLQTWSQSKEQSDKLPYAKDLSPWIVALSPSLLMRIILGAPKGL